MGGGGWAETSLQEKSFGGGTPDSLPERERPKLRHIDKYVRAELPCLSKRYTVAVLTCVGFMISFGMRCNMAMAKLQFQRINETDEADHGLGVLNNATNTAAHLPTGRDLPHKKWSVATESMVDSSFFWGYLLTQVPGGFLASKYPATRIFGLAIVTSSVLNLLVPGATEIHPTFVILVRICQGLVEGFTYPACHGIWRHWAPPLERSRLATLAFCGSYAGIVIGMPLCGLLTSAISWRASFYAYGILGVIWFVIWLWMAFERPSKHPFISLSELKYIEDSLGSTTQQSVPTIATTPWSSFLTSMPVYAIIVANFCRSWNFYMLVLFQASFLQERYNLEIAETGFLGSLPHLVMTIIVPSGGHLADTLRKRGIMSTTMVRKLFNCGGFGMEGFFFLIVAYSTTAKGATWALTFGVAFSGFAISGFNVNHLDIAPRYASILMGMSNGIGTIAGLICPIVIDNLTSDRKSESWTPVFISAACVHFCGVIFYGIFASGELQPWAEPPPEEAGMGAEALPGPGAPGGKWDPMEGSAPPPRPAVPPPPYSQAVAAPDATQPLAQSTNPFAYGAVAQGGSTNPFSSSALNAAWDTAPAQDAYMSAPQPVQPEATDSYMHGSVHDRAY
ncbi:vesicular glutamate transporter 1 isoform X1 [Frankliniella occidentalis]|uniref:Vesicular glutamate transporter 1 isoform X1 n=1 Tax=Frankliniella occidentalis TaxID=133901 RepID=A0A9C6XTC1_FRAOC|nr:vesicular glutamate transporter 1 isoform X1 [Frankliniella occidentalis]